MIDGDRGSHGAAEYSRSMYLIEYRILGRLWTVAYELPDVAFHDLAHVRCSNECRSAGTMVLYKELGVEHSSVATVSTSSVAIHSLSIPQSFVLGPPDLPHSLCPPYTH